MQRAVSVVVGRVRRTVADHAMLRPGERVLVAVSGGADSVGLLLALYHSRRTLGIELVAAHVNHGLRGAEAAADEECAAEAARRLAVPFVRCRLRRGRLCGSNLEEKAREARYAALQRLARRHGCTRIATGHTRDDQAETLLLRLVRGTGPAGLAGIEPVRADGVVRPVLDCTRSQLEALVKACGFRFRTDAMNLDRRFARVVVRQEVMPVLRRLNPRVDEALASLAAAVRGRTALQRLEVGRWRAGAEGRVLEAARLRRMPAEAAAQVVRQWLLAADVAARRLRARHVELVLRLARGNSRRGSVRLADGIVVRRSGEGLAVARTRAGGSPR